jgi:hypothetical protein
LLAITYLTAGSANVRSRAAHSSTFCSSPRRIARCIARPQSTCRKFAPSSKA